MASPIYSLEINEKLKFQTLGWSLLNPLQLTRNFLETGDVVFPAHLYPHKYQKLKNKVASSKGALDSILLLILT